MKIRAKCFQITHKTMALFYTEGNINKGPLTLSILSWEDRLMKKKNFQGAIQSTNEIFAGPNPVKFCLSEDECV